MYTRFGIIVTFVLLAVMQCPDKALKDSIQTVTGRMTPGVNDIWLSHEHILVDFIGADRINRADWDPYSVQNFMRPFLEQITSHGVTFFVDATPAYLGRDAQLLERISEQTGLKILTNTGFYGAVNNKYVPGFAFDMSPAELAELWTDEFENGIDGTEIRPGFIKIGVDAADTLHPMHAKLVHAAALTHLATGLTVASHTGEAKGLWPQLKILTDAGVAPEAFIWIHSQNEKDNNAYLRAAQSGCWISLDGLGWELESHVEKLVFAKQNGILDQVLISHDSGWYDPQKEKQIIQPYTAIFNDLIPMLKNKGFDDSDISMLLNRNPAKAFGIRIRKNL